MTKRRNRRFNDQGEKVPINGQLLVCGKCRIECFAIRTPPRCPACRRGRMRPKEN